MTEIEVRNFQSIEHATLQVEGFTAVAGRSNIGKSAFVRAVKSALTGASGTSFVRHGSSCTRRLKDSKACKCQASVRIKREGFDLLWEKGDAVNRYTFNGKVFDSAERGTPTFLMEGYAPIKVADRKELLQVSDQFDPIFLLNQSGPSIADVLSDVAHLDRINIAMRLVEKDRKEAASVRKVREQDIVNLTQALVVYDGLDEAIARVRAVEDKLAEVDRASTRLRQVERFLEAGSARADEIRYLAGVEAVLTPDGAPMREAASVFGRLVEWLERLQWFKAWHERTRGLDGVGIPIVGPLRDALASFVALTALNMRYDALSVEVDRLHAASAKMDEDARSVRLEWDTLGVCPTCEQACGGQALSV